MQALLLEKFLMVRKGSFERLVLLSYPQRK